MDLFWNNFIHFLVLVVKTWEKPINYVIFEYLSILPSYNDVINLAVPEKNVLSLQPRSHCNENWYMRTTRNGYKKLEPAVWRGRDHHHITHSSTACGCNSTLVSLLILRLQGSKRGRLDLHATTVPYITSNPVFSSLKGSWNALYAHVKLHFFKNTYLSLDWFESFYTFI